MIELSKDLDKNLPITLNVNYNSPAFALNHKNGFALQVVITGTPVGTLKLQISNDGTNWTDLDGTSIIVNGAGNAFWHIVDSRFGLFRLVYTSTSSTGSLTVAKVNLNSP